MAALLLTTAVQAQEAVKDLSPNVPDEARIKTYSFEKAVAFMDQAAVEWTRKRTCFACHTNYALLYARPLVSAKAPAHDETRAALEKMVTVRWKELKPRWDAEVVASAAALAFNDAKTTGKLHAATKLALDRMWTVQRADGGWSWLICGWPPMENDDHYGVTLAALAVGVAPEGYAKTEAAQAGMAKMKSYFAKNPPKNAHHKGMLLWADVHAPGLVSGDERAAWTKEIRGLQLPDGGWSSAGIFPWKRGDKKEQTPEVADGYATGFSLYVLRQTGVATNDPAIRKGVTWLQDNQRESGRWFSRSLFRDSKHFLSHAGTAFAVMALKECEEK